MKFQNVIEIQAPITAVFEFVADMRNIPKWNYFVMRVVQESGNGPKLGARYHQTRKTDNQRYEITHYEPVQSLTIQSLPGSSLGFKRHLRFESVVDGTRLIDQMSLRTRYPSILERLAVGGIRKAVAANLGKLKELLENGQTQLQDGQVINLT
ncbi:SRPBCC family protein [Chloroflexi bacterium TSY]|nr:SRPBCC family protein [Chloroflexi bacterium TSY]